MSYTEKVKNEISSQKLSEIENRYLFLGYAYINADIKDNNIIIRLENISTARKLFKTLKYCYYQVPKITVRNQKRFKTKKILILEINDNKIHLKDELNNLNLIEEEDKKSFIKGIFLASGNISDPKNSNYHLELTFESIEKCNYVKELLKEFNYSFKYLKRNNNHMLYLKLSEQISDFLKLLEVVNELFYFEDIRIYKDHKNMVNRLNNCEQANFEKSLNTSNNQINQINYLKENNYFDLLDDKTKILAEYRIIYKEQSYAEFASILSEKLDKKVTKSYVNHHFRKISNLYNKVKNK